MQKLISATTIILVVAVVAAGAADSKPQGGAWGNLKGRVVWGGAELPKAKKIEVKTDASHCLGANPTADKDSGTILDEAIIVNPKNKGLKNVFVYILVEPGNKLAINPNSQKFPKEVVIDQPACMFFPRALALREGQILVVNNTAPVQHNIRWLGDGINNQGGNVTLNPGNKHEVKDLKAQRLPLSLECNIHGWMKGRLGVFDHPYFAITDESGNFEIKDAPAGAHKLMIYHEDIGYRLGLKGKNGEDVTVKPASTDMGDLPMGK